MPILGSIIKKMIDLRARMPREINTTEVNAQRKLLKKLLKKSRNTAFGERFGFSKILQEDDFISAYQKAVPIYEYNTIYRDWWSRTLNGESYVCRPGRIKYFALSSGTSEASSKYIPVTKSMQRSIQKTSIRQIMSLAYFDLPKEFFSKGILMLGGSTRLQHNGTYFAGDLSGITTGNIPFWFQHFYKPGRRISKESDWPTKLNEMVKKAKDWDIGIVCGVPAWVQILFEKIIEYYKVDSIHDIWPNFEIYVHGGVSIKPYKRGFEKLVGKKIAFLETYLASEGFIAFQIHPDKEVMQMVIDNGLFYEFVPFTDENFDEDSNIKPKAKTYLINEVENGVEYALLITTSAGAYRYLIGDTIKFSDVTKNEMYITGRTKHFMSLCGEHLSQDNMDRAINMAEDKLNVDIREYTLTGIEHDKMFAHRWYFGTDSKVDKELLAKTIDENLKVLNDDYRVERLEAIRSVQAEVMHYDVFYEWMKAIGKEGGQSKFPRVLRGERLNSWIKFLEEKKNKGEI